MDNAPLSYFDLQPAPPPLKPWQKRSFWLTAVFVILGVGLMAGLAVFVVNSILLQRDSGGGRVSELDQAREMADELANGCAEGDMACENRSLSDAARSTQVPEACLDLADDAAKANCVTLIAIDEANPETCVWLSAEARTECRDAANLALAKASDSLLVCDQIEDALLALSCVNQVFGAPSPSYAAAPFHLGSAGCETLSDQTEAASCLDFLRDSDSDGDGLSDLAEIDEHGTDPGEADTDQDGFDDGTEVQNGYNPLQ